MSVLLLVALAVWFWWQPAPETAISESAQHSVQSGNTPLAQPNKASLGVSNTSSPTLSLPTPAPVLSDSTPSPEIIRQHIEAQNVPIEFYGKAIDENGNPLSGVKVSVKVRHWKVTTPIAFGAEGQMIPVEKETGQDGDFQINGVTGDGFDVESLGKIGYELEPGQHSYGAAGGSIESPVVFKMWATNIHEQLISGKNSFHIEPDGRPYVIDLTKGSIAEAGKGDLKIWVKRPAQIALGQKYDWSCEVDAINGGLLQEDNLNSSMYSAPTNGYISAFQFEQKIESGWGDSTGLKRFFVRLNNGQVYGRITIELIAYYNDRIPGMIRLQYALNPSGSPVLR